MRSVWLGFIVCVIVACAGESRAANVFWASGAGDALYDNTGTDVSGSADWLFQLVVDTDNNTDLAALALASTWNGAGSAGDVYQDALDVTIGTWNANWSAGSVQGPAGGQSTLPDATYSGDRYYFRFFNAAASGATHMGIIYNDGTDPSAEFQWKVVDATTAPFYSAADLDKQGTQAARLLGTGAFADGWQTTIAVPEPASMMLFALGLLTFVAKRRKS